ncbi:MAG: dephospho-CoA kinase [Chthoniobacterales bacterium]|nr:dephospho-CoA kinase [Chthoniobacterales bacterium]
MVIGITGGISTGKSTFSERLRELLEAKLFDADRAARQLVVECAEVRALIRREFGAQIFSPGGDLNRAALRAIVFADQGKKRALEQILHPRIRLQWATEAEKSRRSGKIFLADIPLLYETEGEKFCDRTVVVACSQEIQLQRLITRTRLSSAVARTMISAQMPLEQKISRADHVIWNNGPLTMLAAQAESLARYLAPQ